MIRVALVDDHTLVRAGLRGLLQLDADVQVVAEAEDAAGAVTAIRASRPDVVLLDLRMPPTAADTEFGSNGGLEVLDALRRAQALPPTLILTTFDDDALVLTAIRLGARGFLLKDVTFEQLLGAVRTLAAGGTLIRPAVPGRARAWLTDGAPEPEPPRARLTGLSAREREVVHLLAGGYSNKEIGAALGMAEGTAKNHVSNVLAKLGVRDRLRAVLKAAELGYL